MLLHEHPDAPLFVLVGISASFYKNIASSTGMPLNSSLLILIILYDIYCDF